MVFIAEHHDRLFRITFILKFDHNNNNRYNWKLVEPVRTNNKFLHWSCLTLPNLLYVFLNVYIWYSCIQYTYTMTAWNIFWFNNCDERISFNFSTNFFLLSEISFALRLLKKTSYIRLMRNFDNTKNISTYFNLTEPFLINLHPFRLKISNSQAFNWS